MLETIFNIFNEIITSNPLSTIGLLLIISFLGSKIFQRFGIPQVVGFIVLGVLHGPSFLNVIPLDVSQELLFISEVALGLIGFDMGSHLRFSEIRKLGKSILFILIFEAFGAFFLVTLGVYALTRTWYTALIFGALSSATAPAATVDVLAEYDAKGPLTTTLLAVVGLDDAISLLLYSLAAAFATSLMAGGETLSLFEILELPFIEIGGSLILGASMGFGLNWLLHRMKNRHDAMAISIGFVLLGAGVSLVLDFSLILTTMVLGSVTVNCCPDHGRRIRYTIEQAGPVIYVLFFTLVGARFQIDLLPTMGLLGLAYIILRSTGKFGGAWIGGQLGQAEPVVRNNLGFGLLSQAGVAVGLALASASRFSQYGAEGQALGSLIINVITATTFVVQIIGPIFVKFAITQAGEIGKAKMKEDAWASEGSPE
ncbi:MAG: cation:proton antiporter [Anaerolineales bacterium]|jgi:Kef-type K+ transport system membrane component KefB